MRVNDYTAKITIGVKNGKKYYDHALAEIEKGKLLDQIKGQAVVSERNFKTMGNASEPSSEPYVAKDKRLLSILQTNSSKVLDEEGKRQEYLSTIEDYSKATTESKRLKALGRMALIEVGAKQVPTRAEVESREDYNQRLADFVNDNINTAPTEAEYSSVKAEKTNHGEQSPRDKAVLEALTDKLAGAIGVDNVITNHEEGQRVLDMANGNGFKNQLGDNNLSFSDR